MNKNILITGSSGFVGVNYFKHSKFKQRLFSKSLQQVEVEELNLKGVEAVLHLAGIAHRMDQPEGSIYYDVNTDLTFELAKKAKSDGVKHFVFISTIKVYGEGNQLDSFYDEKSSCKPQDDYGKSKLQAELKLKEIEDENFIISIVRPSLVYGEGVKGNLYKLMSLVQKGYVLPFGYINNQRTMVYVENLVALIDRILEFRSSGIYIAGDSEPISSTFLIQQIQKAFGQKSKLVSLPSPIRWLFSILKPNLHKRLFGSLVVSNEMTNKSIDFIPPYTSEYGIAKMVKAFVSK